MRLWWRLLWPALMCLGIAIIGVALIVNGMPAR
jgi:hypothetical protein